MGVSFGLSEFAVVFATLLGPVLAVQAQRYVDLQRERQQRRVVIFRTLMATRATSLAGSHVEALNAIPIEFYGAKRNYKEVVDQWRLYLDHLSAKPVDGAWVDKRQDLFIDLLWKLGVALGYSFTKLELKKEVYSPVAHADLEEQQELIRKGLTAIFKGEAALPLDIKSMPVTPEAAEKQQQLSDLLIRWLTDPKVGISPPDGADKKR
jgi:hypothetical protein